MCTLAGNFRMKTCANYARAFISASSGLYFFKKDGVRVLANGKVAGAVDFHRLLQGK
jgi:hypothetical protein